MKAKRREEGRGRTAVVRPDGRADDEEERVARGSYAERVLGTDESRAWKRVGEEQRRSERSERGKRAREAMRERIRRTDVERVTGLSGYPTRIEHDQSLDKSREGLAVERLHQPRPSAFMTHGGRVDWKRTGRAIRLAEVFILAMFLSGRKSRIVPSSHRYAFMP